MVSPSSSAVATLFLLLFFLPPSPTPAADYQRDIKPLLRSRCFSCHGALKQKADLRLDTVDFIKKGGESGPALLPGQPAKSLLIERVTEKDPDDRMPPRHEGEPLSPTQIQLLQDWIAAGSPAPKNELPEPNPRSHWAFLPPSRPPIPSTPNSHWIRNPIDAFIAQNHQAHSLAPQPDAPPLILLRRLFFDLIGLPPSNEEINAFLSNPHPDAYAQTAERLLHDPRHGERWARHYMDIWRYSDWWGLDDQLRNSQKYLWHWRDWIVESLNANTPYDQLIREMLAADELYPTDRSKLRATGYLARNFFLFNRNQWLDETVEHLSKGFLGLTINCAKCHDHKYDPITHSDFYKLRAFFEPYQVRTDTIPAPDGFAKEGIPRAFDASLTTPTYRFFRGEESKPDRSKVIAPGVPEILAFKDLDIHPISLPPEAWQTDRSAWMLDSQIQSAQSKIPPAELLLSQTKEKIAQSPPPDPPSPLLDAELKFATLNLKKTQADLLSISTRAAATQLSWATPAPPPDTTNSANSLAANAERSAHLATAESRLAELELQSLQAPPNQRPKLEKDLQAARTSLEKLTKSLALPPPKFTPLLSSSSLRSPTRFLDSTKDDPSTPFPSQSSGRRSALADWITDPRNPLTARVAVNHLWTRHFGTPLVPNLFDFGRKNPPPIQLDLLNWLASELIDSGYDLRHLHRLIVNSSTYRLSSANPLPSTDPENLFWSRRTPIRLESQAIRDSLLALSNSLDLTFGGPPIPPSKQDQSLRRSLYFFHSNNQQNLFLSAFDNPTVKECYRREQSIVPQQALALTNSRLTQEAASKIALQFANPDDSAFITHSFRLLLGFTPNPAELASALATLNAWNHLPNSTPQSSRSRLILALINHNDFVTLR